jgi:hypothetical protein
MLNERSTFHGAVKGEVAHAIRDYGESNVCIHALFRNTHLHSS